jgi:penicillin-binding protein 1C
MTLPRRKGLIAAAWSVATLLLGLAAIDRAAPPDLSRAATQTHTVEARDGSVLRAFLASDGMWRLPASVAEVDPLYLAMLKGWEDQRFDAHPGVDPLAIARAMDQAVSAGRIVSGASTLSMQTARLLEPRARTLLAKVSEMGRALQLERDLGKDGVLDLYLTLAPFGGNLEGVRAASLAYFGKEPAELSPAEAALLVALPQSPERLRPDRFPEAARAARDRVLARAAELGILTADEAERAMAAAVPTGRLDLPFLAPHLAERLEALHPRATAIATTIDAGLQATIEQMIAMRLPAADPRATLAIIVVDNATMEVLAQVGAWDYFDAGRQGMVDMTQAIRSPGSTLKPLIYGLAFDRRLLHPDTLIEDRPRNFAGYRPVNFDGGFAGMVRVREALAWSLNVPAVAVLDRLGATGFDTALADAGIRLVYPAGASGPSLPLALGGVGVTLSDLTMAYAGIANGGMVRPLVTLLEDGEQMEGTALMAPFAAWYLADILREAPRAGGFVQDGSARPIAFKTGTSYGYRDAWTVGFTREHTIGVWVGRADGSPCAGCVGIDTASPILLSIFDLFPGDNDPAANPPEAVTAMASARLPAYLARFDRGAEANGPEMSFPVDGARLRLAWDDGAAQPMPLRVDGGQAPFAWFVNGTPVSADRRGDATWVPDGNGFAAITVTDAMGRSAQAEVFVEIVGRP